MLGIALALFLGKQVGIFAASASPRSWLAQPPEGATWAQVYGVALLCGIGFTMSLFIGGLAFPGDRAMIDQVKVGVLARVDCCRRWPVRRATVRAMSELRWR